MTKKTDRQKLFIAEYLKCWNASEAARRAGYRSKANVIGSQLLAKISIRAEIDAHLAVAGMSADEVLARLADQARADMRNFVRTDKQGNPTGFDLRPDKPLHLVKKVSVTDKGVTFELYDAQAALVKLGEYHKLFVQRSEVSVIGNSIELTWGDGAGASGAGNDANPDASAAPRANPSQAESSPLQSAGGGAAVGQKPAGGGPVPG